jgi:hypothetical protein
MCARWPLQQVTPLKMVPNSAPQLPFPCGMYAEENKHPSNGGNPYSYDFRNNVITRFLLHLPLNFPSAMLATSHILFAVA